MEDKVREGRRGGDWHPGEQTPSPTTLETQPDTSFTTNHLLPTGINSSTTLYHSQVAHHPTTTTTTTTTSCTALSFLHTDQIPRVPGNKASDWDVAVTVALLTVKERVSCSCHSSPYLSPPDES
ncbi:hypothetical protein E2C01_028494 [Portunus trituberculatus]|uniref:Uncharacterized protein n=1 Tax=Portunus trituberculatus TaxID=210409 RepID=A0A5B7EKK5_PORTR|nr:hypothetical protein [Portunus trituberculatus]